MRQVPDAFKLLERTTSKTITWRLLEAKTNSPPFSVTAEAENEVVALEQEKEFTRGVAELKAGRVPDIWADDQSRDLVRDLLARVSRGANLELVGAIGQPVRIDAQEAAIGERAINQPVYEFPRTTKTQLGSIEGTLESVESYWNKPAIRLLERKTLASIACELAPELAEELKNTKNFDDVWRHRRVLIHGLIQYNRAGRIVRVIATGARVIDPREVPLDEIQDPSFTDGLLSLEYLTKLRDGLD